MSTDLLAPYRMINQRHRDLTRELLAWSLRLCSCGQGAAWHAQTAYVAATFETCGAPSDATLDESLLGGKYIVFFLCLDDGPTDQLANLEQELRSGRPAASGECGVLCHALLDEMNKRALDTQQFTTELADFCSAMATEAQHDVRTMTEEQFHALRRQTIGNQPYITCWRAIRGLPVPTPGSEAQEFNELAVEAVYLVNDLASITKDEEEVLKGAANAYVTSNWVLFHARSPGELHTAIDTAITRYSRIVDTFVHAPQTPFASLLSSIVDGNLDAHLSLTSMRYPGSAQILRVLPHIGS
ncbi:MULTISPECIES: terpene synthase family protein [unclassified Streptomyces]|uniref:terpene synthase family protein n=1 Tax=unclassified Streptomyces TaxID=2593676 RepID=UPI002E16B6E2